MEALTAAIHSTIYSFDNWDRGSDYPFTPSVLRSAFKFILWTVHQTIYKCTRTGWGVD